MTIIAHVDMDCFFCSCEEKYNPELIGTPVIVGGLGIRGVVSAANYTARKYGVYSAMAGSIAKKKCPDANFLPVNMHLYKKESEQVMQILDSFADEMIQASIDEAYLDLTKFSNNFCTLEEMAIFIKNRVKEKTQLTCSIGVSKCRITSKIASDYNKPNGITIVRNQEKFLSNLDVMKMPGIGKKSVGVYYKNNIFTLGDLAKSDVFKILDIGGTRAIEYQQIAKGIKQSKLLKRESTKSISTERTFSQDTSDLYQLNETLDEMCEKVYSRLEYYKFRTISLKIRYDDFKTINRDYSIQLATNSKNMIKQIIKMMFKDNYEIGYPIRLIGVKLTNLVKDFNSQTTLEKFINVSVVS